MFRPLTYGFGFTVNRKPVIPALIIALLKLRRPLAIFWSIVAVNIFSFQRQSLLERWFHVGKEGGKGPPPFAANSYSSPSVQAIAVMGFTVASHVHPGPSRIEWVPALPVRGRSSDDLFRAHTAAGLGSSGDNIAGLHNFIAPAVARRQNLSVSATFVNAKNDESSKLMSNPIFKFDVFHASNYLTQFTNPVNFKV